MARRVVTIFDDSEQVAFKVRCAEVGYSQQQAMVEAARDWMKKKLSRKGNFSPDKAREIVTEELSRTTEPLPDSGPIVRLTAVVRE